MRIGIDAHPIGTHAGGNETFIRELLEGLQFITPETDIVAYVNKAFHGDSQMVGGFATWPLRFKSSWVRVPIELPIAAHRSRADLLHVQYIAPPMCPCPFVVTVHDIVWAKYPEFLPRVTRMRLETFVPWTVRRAARVFAVTNAMREAIADEYGIPLDRIDLIQTACDPMFHPETNSEVLEYCRRKYSIDGDYILYVGALQPRKNLARLAAAFARLKEKGLDHKLVIVGKKTWLYEEMLKEIGDLELGDRIIFTGYVDQADLPGIISDAAAFAYVSIYEGYGLPVIEAMACATPVLASTDPAITEVAGGAALHCDPLSVKAIEDGLVRILTDTELRNSLKELGPKRAAHFTRENMARAAIEGYAKVFIGDGSTNRG